MPFHLFSGPWPRKQIGMALLAASMLIASAGIGTAASAVATDPVGALEQALLAQPDQPRIMLDLAQALLQRARASRDAANSDRAHALIQRALEKLPDDPRAWTLKTWDEMNRHRFPDALISVRRALGLGVPTAVALGLEADTLVELGRYREAVAVTQRLLDAFPGLPAYSRAAHLRMLHGDLSGAIDLLKEGLVDAPKGSEAHAWAFRQLAELYLNAARFTEAEQAVAMAGTLFPAAAQDAGLRARIREAEHRPAEALALFLRAAEEARNPEYVLAAWRLARQTGDGEEARRLGKLLDGMARLDTSGDRLFRRTFAEYALLQGRLGEAEQLAREEFRVRPDIYGHALLSLVLAQSGNRLEAARHGKEALSLGTQDIRLQQWARGRRPSEAPLTAHRVAAGGFLPHPTPEGP